MRLILQSHMVHSRLNSSIGRGASLSTHVCSSFNMSSITDKEPQHFMLIVALNDKFDKLVDTSKKTVDSLLSTAVITLEPRQLEE